MARLRIVGLALIAAFAMSALATAAASAAAPEFLSCQKVAAGTGKYKDSKCKTEGGKKEFELKTPVKTGFKDKSGVGTLTAAGTSVTCKKDTSTGKITGAKTVGAVFVTFEGCEAEKEGKKCKVNGGTIKTNELEGELGKVAAAEATSLRGLDLKPVAADKGIFVTLEGTCLPISPAPVEGSVIGEATPVGEVAKVGKLEYKLEGGKQKIQKFEGGVKDTLEVFKVAEATEATSDEVTYEEAVEVS